VSRKQQQTTGDQSPEPPVPGPPPDPFEELVRQLTAAEAPPPEETFREVASEGVTFARVDTGRPARNVLPEVVLGLGKTVADATGIFRELLERSGYALATRLTSDAMAALKEQIRDLRVSERCMAAAAGAFPSPLGQGATAVVVTAGTSDLVPATEAAFVLEEAGAQVTLLADVGVAGLHRLIDRAAEIASAAVCIVFAGMDGALPSVVGGLVPGPVIAVPTSQGYGAAFSGVSALLAMLNSCAPGVTVVNIDNGLGAAAAALRILGAGERRAT
jgi:hypothetical protein